MVRTNDLTYAAILSLIAGVAGLPAHAQSTRLFENWSITEVKDAMTDKVSVHAVTTNLEVHDRDEPFMLAVFCFDKALRAGLRTNGLWLSQLNGTIAVSSRVDDAKARRSIWYLARNGKGADSLVGDQVVTSLRSGVAVRFRVEASGHSHEAVFSLKGARNAIAEVERSCKRGQ